MNLQNTMFRILTALGIWHICDRIDGHWRLKITSAPFVKRDAD